MPTNDALFFVYLVDAHEGDDPATTTLLQEACKLSDIPIETFRVTGRRGLNLALGRRLKDCVANHHLPPVIHIVSHGVVESSGGQCLGIHLRGGEQVAWPDLAAMLEPVVAAQQGDAIVCLSACRGAHGNGVLLVGTDLPYVVASSISVSWAQTAVAFASFYHVLDNFHGDIEKAVQAMNAACGFPLQLLLPFRLIPRSRQHNELRVQLLELRSAGGWLNEFEVAAYVAAETDEYLCEKMD